MAHSWVSSEILDGTGNKISSDILKGKVVGLYFSASWCPPCRAFSPVLAKWVADFKANNPHKDELEVMFVSSDRDEASFKEYHGHMGFLALPYVERDLKTKLAQRFKVSGIPTLVFVDAEGKTLTTNGRSIVQDDPEGKEFPWNPKSLAEILGDSFVNGAGETVSRSSIKGPYGIYFSASWCPPCHAFTPKLAETYKHLKSIGKDFEIIFSSSDQDEESFKEYFAEMPWLAIPYADRKRDSALSQYFNVEGIPTFVILDANNNIITKNGRGAVAGDPKGENFPWAPTPLNVLDENSAGDINDAATLLVFTDSSDAQIAVVKEGLLELATADLEKSKQTGAEPELIYTYVTDKSDEDMLNSIRQFAKIKSTTTACILNIPAGVKYFCEGALTAENLKNFVTDFKAGKLTSVPLRS